MRRHLAGRCACSAARAATLPGLRGLFFVSASYHGRSLLSGAQELAETVREAMGPNRPPHLVSLFATPYQEWGAGLADLPQYVRQLLAWEGGPPPVVLGGVLRRVAGGSHYSREGEPCVSLLAAHLPGVRLLPFHTTHGSLPTLGGGASWAELIRAARAGAGAHKPPPPPPTTPPTPAAASARGSASAGVTAAAASGGCGGSSAERGPGVAAAPTGAGGGSVPPQRPQSGSPPRPESTAALLLSTPHFVDVEQLLSRLGLVVPSMRVVGGVTAPGAWGDSENDWGAVWLNDRAYAQGAVGCVLQGRFKVDSIVSPGFRGAGPLMRVTQAQGQHVLEVDGEPVQKPLQRAISEALNTGDLATALKIGVGVAGGAEVAARPPKPPAGDWGASHWVRPGAPQPPQPPATGAAPPAGAQLHRPSPPQSAFPSRPPPPGGSGAPSAQATNSREPQSQGPPPLQVQRQEEHQQQQQQQQQLVTRNWFFHQAPPRPVMTVATSEPITRGTAIQVHLQNYPAAHRHMRDRLREYSERLPPRLAASAGSMACLGLSCSSLPFLEHTDVARCLPSAAFAGGKVEGEICSSVEGQPSRLHSFASCLAILRPPDDEAAGEDGATAAGAPDTAA